jgi:hypothetical protein
MDVFKMPNNLYIKFFNRIKNMEDEEYLISIIKYHGAPALSGIKPAFLISFDSGRRCLYRLWERYKVLIVNKINMNYLEIINSGSRALVLFYRSDKLEKTLLESENLEYLVSLGYAKDMTLNGFLELLKSRFGLLFPHEVGIFLGIPVEDVDGFVKNSGRGFIMNGYWKVYGRPELAMDTFKKYDDARVEMINSIINH